MLDLANLFPAPLLAALLGDFGADVVKVEPPEGDALRTVGARRQGTSTAWALAARNKRSVVLDLSAADGIATLGALCTAADVVIVNQPEAVLERWQCDYERVRRGNPAVVYVAMSAFGASGPRAASSGNGTIAEAFAGFAHLNGAADGPPTLPSVALGDTLAAISALNGVLAALYWRDANDGTGQFVDASIYEPVLTLLGTALAGWDPATAPPMRAGSRIASAVPRNVYRARDGDYIAVSGTTDQQVARLLALVGADDAGSMARFGRAATRAPHDADALDAMVAAWIAANAARDVLAALDGARIPATRVNDLAAVVADPQVTARASVVAVTQPDGVSIALPGASPRLGSTPATLRAAPELGAHTREVLAEWLEPRS